MVRRRAKKSEFVRAQENLAKARKKELKTVTSTQTYNPIADVKDGIIITSDGRFIKIIPVIPCNFQLRSPSEQNKIISAFASLLRIMPDKFQIKVLSQRSDVSNFVRALRQRISEESDKNCRVLQKDQLELIERVGSEGVSRSFYIIYEYNNSNRGIGKKPTFQDIRYDLETTAAKVREMLTFCGNDVVDIVDPDEFVLRTVYNIFCRKQAMEMTYNDHAMQIITNKALLSEGNSDDDVFIPVADLISPTMINTKRSPKYVIIDGLYYAFGYIPGKAYPPSAYGGWMSILVNLGDGIDVDLFADKQAPAAVQRKLQYAIRLGRAKMTDTDSANPEFSEIQDQVAAGQYLQDALASGDDVYLMSILLTVIATSAEELRSRVDWLQSVMITYTLRLKMCNFRQAEAFESCLPLARLSPAIASKAKRNVTTPGLAAAYPFVSSVLADNDGILLGITTPERTPVFVNIFDSSKYNNANIAILGTSGAGKTYALQCLALRMRQQGITTFIIAPDKGHEFLRACKAIGGQPIKISPGSRDTINVMEIRKPNNRTTSILDGDQRESILMKKVQTLHAFFSLIVPNMTTEETNALDVGLMQTYAKFGITANNQSLVDPNNPDRFKQMPILTDLYDKLNDNNKSGSATRLISALEYFVKGSAKSFSRPTNVNLDNPYIVIDISDLTKELLPVGMFIALDFVWDKAREDRTERKAIFMDELWTLIGAKSSKQAAEFTLEIFKVIRGYGGSAIAATQDLNDFFALDGGAYGKGIISNAQTKILMKMEPTEVDFVGRTLKLTEAEQQSISGFKRGECLLMAGHTHTRMAIEASPSENTLITTDREQLRSIAQMLSGESSR